MKRAIALWAMAALTGCATARSSEPTTGKSAGTRIELAVGGQRVLPIAGVTSFATGNDVVQIKTFDDGRQLLLKGAKPGSTGLTLLYVDGKLETYDIRVAADRGE